MFAVDPEATLQWLWVVPRRRLQFTSPGCEPALIHSVLLIQSPLAGKFVLDPSGEQYGIPAEHRFIRWRDYVDRYVMRNKNHYGAQVWMIAHNGEEDFENGTGHAEQYWRDIREVLGGSIKIWLHHVTAGGSTLRQALGNEASMKEQDKWVGDDLVEKLVDVDLRPFWPLA